MEGKPRVVLVVTSLQASEDGTVVRAFAEQEPASAAVEPVSQQKLDSMISAGNMPALCMASETVAAQWGSCVAQPGVSMEIHLAAAAAAAAAAVGGQAAQVLAETERLGRAQRMEYLDSYGNLAVHRLMLEDRPRTESYRAAIRAAINQLKSRANSSAIRVLDVGAGTGVLSMFAAAAAAEQGLQIQVVAVEGSKMATLASQLVASNGFSASITVVQSAIEDLAELPGGPVDIIVSEWMGFYLLHESMLPSVLWARDRWLKRGGLMLPSHATIYAAPLSQSKQLEFWHDVYGLDYRAAMPSALAESAATNPRCDSALDPLSILAPAAVVANIDCTTVTVAELERLRLPLSWAMAPGTVVHGAHAPTPWLHRAFIVP